MHGAEHTKPSHKFTVCLKNMYTYVSMSRYTCYRSSCYEGNLVWITITDDAALSFPMTRIYKMADSRLTVKHRHLILKCCW
jgi:hypothetical protein